MLTELESRLNAEIKSIYRRQSGHDQQTLDLQSIQDEVAQMQAIVEKVGSEVEALNVELGAPPRIRTIEDASSRKRVTRRSGS